jgi:hypothetical protein
MDAQTVNNAAHQQATAICTCIKVSIQRNSKQYYDNCFKTKVNTGFSGFRSKDKYLAPDQKASGFSSEYLNSMCPEVLEGLKKFVLYPINFEENDAEKLLKKKNFNKWTEKYLAFNGVIVDERTIQGSIYHKVQLGSQFVWMSYPLSNQEFYGAIGAEIKTIGTLIFNDESVIDALEDADFYFSVFSVRNMSNYDTYYDPNFEAEFFYWRDKKKIPKYNKN